MPTETLSDTIMACLTRQTKNCDVYEITEGAGAYGKIYVPRNHADGAHVVRIQVTKVGS